MTSPFDSPVFTVRVEANQAPPPETYTQAPLADITAGISYSEPMGLWGKISGGLGKVAIGIRHYAKEVMPYLSQAAPAIANALGSNHSDYSSAYDGLTSSLTYQPQTTQIKSAITASYQPVQIEKIKPVGQSAAAKLQTLENHLSQQAQRPQQRSYPPVRIQSALSQQSRLYQAPVSTINGQVSPVPPAKSRMLFSPKQAPQNPQWIKEQPYSTKGVQRPVSYNQLYQEQSPSFMPPSLLNPAIRVSPAVIKRPLGVKPAQRLKTPNQPANQTQLASKATLNQAQTLLAQLFGRELFDSSDFQNPYELRNGQKVVDPNISRTIAIANWILFRQPKASWTAQDIQAIQNRIGSLTPEQEHQLEVAKKLHLILKANEESGKQRDDALALAKGYRAVIEENSLNGTVNEEQVMQDLRFFFIDQPMDLVGSMASPLHQFQKSNAAFNLFGGPRIGTIGWKSRFWDHGQQYQPQAKGKPQLINQAHHFTALFIASFESNNIGNVKNEAKVLDGIRIRDFYNAGDLRLSESAIQLGEQVQKGETSWRMLPQAIYKLIHM